METEVKVRRERKKKETELSEKKKSKNWNNWHNSRWLGTVRGSVSVGRIFCHPQRETVCTISHTNSDPAQNN